jgi:hypothetical protein
MFLLGVTRQADHPLVPPSALAWGSPTWELAGIKAAQFAFPAASTASLD